MHNICEAVDHPAFGVLLHMGRWNTPDDKGDELCAPYAFHVHCPPAVLDSWEERMRKLIQTGYAGYWGVEQGPSDFPYTEIGWLLATAKRDLGNASSPERSA